nr:unnamed protein product [Callosobruchus chinensis]
MNATDWIQSTNSTQHKLPLSCCPIPSGTTDFFNCTTKVAYNEGCLEVFGDYINSNISYVEGVGIGLAIVQGHLPNHERGGGRPANPEEDEVLEAVEEDPGTSLRAIEITTGVPKSTAHPILKRHELHPYHVQRVQTLLPADYQRRVNFSRTILEGYRDDPFFLTKILWSDESTFKKDGYMNMHNYHEWHVENPHLTRQDRSQYRFKVNMWTGILNGQIIGPFELPDALNGEVYLDFYRTIYQVY